MRRTGPGPLALPFGLAVQHNTEDPNCSEPHCGTADFVFVKITPYQFRRSLILTQVWRPETISVRERYPDFTSEGDLIIPLESQCIG